MRSFLHNISGATAPLVCFQGQRAYSQGQTDYYCDLLLAGYTALWHYAEFDSKYDHKLNHRRR